MRKKVAFIGVGNMATAVICGMISGGFDASDIILFDRHIEKMQAFKGKGAIVASSVAEAAELSDCIMICVKPQGFGDVLPLLASCKNAKEKLYITIAAGISTASVSDAIGGAPVVRALPNTPILICKGVTAICRGDGVSDQDLDFACSLFAPSSTILKTNEDQMNRIICVTSSSPAYMFLIIKSMLDAAASQGLLLGNDNPDGLDEKTLIGCICDTMIGAAYLMKEGTKTPNEQIKTVASKGGTTERAIAELLEYKLPEAFASAMQKCTDRADELGKK